MLVTAHDESDSVGATIAALWRAFPGARVVVADDGSGDRTAERARAAGVEVARSERNIGKGGAATLGARVLLDGCDDDGDLVLLCDADLEGSSAELTVLVDTVEQDPDVLAVATFARRVGGGFGVALGAAGWVIRRRTSLEPVAPISGQRAMTAGLLSRVIPFARGFGMETAMTIDAHRAGARLVEVELPLEHRATGRNVAGFAHRAHQLVDIARVYASRR